MDKSIQLELDNHTAPPYYFLWKKAMAGKILILRLLKSLIMSLIIQSGSLLIIAVCYILSIMKDLPASIDKRTQSSYLYTVEQLGKMFKVGEMNYLVSGSFDEYSVFPLETSSLLEKKSDGFSFNKDLDILLQDVSPEDNQILMAFILSSNSTTPKRSGSLT